MKTTFESPLARQAANDATGSTSTPADDGSGSLLSHLWSSFAATVVLVILCCGLYPMLVWAIGQAAFPFQANGSLIKKDGTPTLKDAEAVGSALLGQQFTAASYFHPRPSAAGNGYDASNSGGSNLGPLSDKLLNGATQKTASATQPVESLALDGVRLRVIHYAVENNIPFKLCTILSDGTRTQVPLSKYQDAQGTLNDVALVNAFPHTGDPADKAPLIATDFAMPIPADAVTASGSGLDPHISPANAKLQSHRIAAKRKISVETVQRLIDQETELPSFGLLGEPRVNVLRLNLALDKTAPIASN